MVDDKVVKIENLEFVNKNKFRWNDLEKKLCDFLDLELIVNNKIVYFDKHAIDEMSSSKGYLE